MYESIVVSITAVILAYSVRYAGFKNGLAYAFGLLTVFLSFRYDFGNDYSSYIMTFNNYNSFHINIFNLKEIANLREKGEIGYVLLNLLCKPIGFFGMIILITVFENVILYNFVKEYVPAKWYWFAIFIYAFNYENMLVGGCSMLRQWLSICIFILSFEYIIKRRIIPYILLVALSASFHSSAWFLLPFYFTTYLKNLQLTWKSLIWFIPLIIGWWLVAPRIILNNLDSLLSVHEFEMYTVYVGDGKAVQLGLGVLLDLVLAFACISQLKEEKSKNRIIIFLFLISILFISIGAAVNMSGRLGLYFSIASIAAYPIVMNRICLKGNPSLAYALITAFMVVILYDYFHFFQRPTWHDKFYTYHSILSVPWR